jgi:hypothetical protein
MAKKNKNLLYREIPDWSFKYDPTTGLYSIIVLESILMTADLEKLVQLRNFAREAIAKHRLKIKAKFEKERKRFIKEVATEEKLKSVLENPHFASVPLNNTCTPPPQYKFTEDGTFVINDTQPVPEKRIMKQDPVTGKIIYATNLSELL